MTLMVEVPKPGPNLYPANFDSWTADARLTHVQGLVASMHSKLTMLMAENEVLRKRVEDLEESATKPTYTRKLRPLDETDRMVYNFMCEHSGLKFSTGALASNLDRPGSEISDVLGHLMAHNLIDRVAAQDVGHVKQPRKRVGAWNYFVPKKEMKGAEGS